MHVTFKLFYSFICYGLQENGTICPQLQTFIICKILQINLISQFNGRRSISTGINCCFDRITWKRKNNSGSCRIIENEVILYQGQHRRCLNAFRHYSLLIRGYRFDNCYIFATNAMRIRGDRV